MKFSAIFQTRSRLALFSIGAFIIITLPAICLPQANADLGRSKTKVVPARQKATAEPPPQAEQTKVNNEGLLKFTDSYRSPSARDFQWVAGFELGSFQAEGKKRLSGGLIQTVSDGNQVIPRISMGTRYNLIEAGPTLSSFYMGFESGIAFSTRLHKVAFPNRTVDAQLNHTMADLGLKTSMSFGEFPNIYLGATLAYGQANSIQTSGDSVADWTEQTQYAQTTFSADYDFAQGWFGTLAFGHRETLSKNSAFNMDQEQWRTGLSFIW